MSINIKKINGALTSDLEIAFTLITATKPNVVTKEFLLNPDGTLNKKTTAHVTAGIMEKINVKGITAFVDILPNLESNQCLVYGVTEHKTVNLMTEKSWALSGRPDTAVPRAAKHMKWPAKGGILMLDYDPPKNGASLSHEELVAQLKLFCPWLQNVAMVWWPSTSSCIYNGDIELTGIRGQRIYIMVKNGSDIPRLGKVINTQLWVNGIGHFEASKSGSLLERSLFDSSVWQTNRIDFAAGAKCHDGLEQKRGNPKLIAGEVSVLDSLAAVPDPSPEEVAKAESHKSTAKAAKREEAAKERQAWIDSQVDELVKKMPGIDIEHAEATVRRAVESRVLMGDWQVMVVYGDAVKAFSVLQILDNPNDFHGLETLDPLEPDYDGGRPVGKLFLFGARPCVHSMAHGGVTYKLIRQPASIEVANGKIHETTNSAFDVLRQNPDVFDFGAGIATLGDNGKLLLLDCHSLGYVLSGIVQFHRRKKIHDGEVISFINPPYSVCKNILALYSTHKLKKLVAVITAPTLRLDGSVLSSLGYDAMTGLLLDAVETPPIIPDKPSKEQAKAALERLWIPFAEFPFVTALDRAVFLAAILTSVVRAALPTAPAIGLDAPVQSSGKTLAARCLGVLATGIEPGILPHTASGSDEEMRKRLFAILRNGDRIVLLDNILGTFDSAAMAALLTSETYSDRVLGRSEVPSVPNRALVIFTGNNLSFSGDMARRVLVSRIDPQTDQPFAREFKLNPVQYCLEHRQQMVADALTLIRFYLSSGVAPLGTGKMGSFEMWDSWVRQTVLFVDKELALGVFGDIMEKVIANQATEPEQEYLGQLMQAWDKVYGGTWQFLNDVISDCLATHSPHAQAITSDQKALAESMNDFIVSRKELTAKALGKRLQHCKDRIVGGMRFEQSKVGKDASRWRIFVLPVVPIKT